MSLKRTTPLRRSGPLPRQSPKRKRLDAIFARKKKAFLAANPVCMVWLELYEKREFDMLRQIWPEDTYEPASVDVHHMRDSMKYYLEQSTWKAVSRRAHDWIEEHKNIAEARGWIIR